MYEEQRVEAEIRADRLPENQFTSAYVDREKRRHPPTRLHPIIELFDRVREQYEAEGLFDPGESIAIDREKVDGSYSTRSWV
jgi:hypothetical protein